MPRLRNILPLLFLSGLFNFLLASKLLAVTNGQSKRSTTSTTVGANKKSKTLSPSEYSKELVTYIEDEFHEHWNKIFDNSEHWLWEIARAQLKNAKKKHLTNLALVKALLRDCAYNPKSAGCLTKVPEKPTNHAHETPVLSALIYENGIPALHFVGETLPYLSGTNNSAGEKPLINTPKGVFLSDLACGVVLYFLKTGNAQIIEIALSYLLARVNSENNLNQDEILHFVWQAHRTLCGLVSKKNFDDFISRVRTHSDKNGANLSRMNSQQCTFPHEHLMELVRTTLNKNEMQIEGIEEMYSKEGFREHMARKTQTYRKDALKAGQDAGSVIEVDPSAYEHMGISEDGKNKLITDSSEGTAEFPQIKIDSLKASPTIKLDAFVAMTPHKVKQRCLNNLPLSLKYAKNSTGKFVQQLCKPKTPSDTTCLLYDCCQENLANCKEIWQSFDKSAQNTLLTAIREDPNLFAKNKAMLGSLCSTNLLLRAELLEIDPELFSCALTMFDASDWITRSMDTAQNETWLILTILGDFYAQYGAESDTLQPHAQNLELLRQVHTALLGIEVEDADGEKNTYKELLEEELESSVLGTRPGFKTWLLDEDEA